jgi:hypothetical protein
MTVRNDATRQTLRPSDPRRPRSVVARQGQVLLDADMDQQARAVLDRIDIGADDTFGRPERLVVPAGSAAFAITPAATPAACGIGDGHGYQRGWLLENVTPGTLATQPHPRDDATPVVPFALVVKALVRHVDPVEEPAWADPALGDAQASGRSIVDWQVLPFAPAAGWASPPECGNVTGEQDWQRMVAPSTGTLAVVPDTAPPAGDPCSLAPDGGYSRAENLLYRIEVHGGGSRAGWPTGDGPRYGLAGLKIKMSRRNASVMARITGIDGTEVTVTPPALDPLNWFAPGTFAEIVSPHDDVDPRHADAGERLFRVAFATDTVVTLDNAAQTLLATLQGRPGWYLRLWDAFADRNGIATVAPTAADPAVSEPIDLGDGLAVRLGAGTDPAGPVLRRGDFWSFAARADGSVDWPAGSPHETPHGPETRYAPLAVVTDPDGEPVEEDCRIPLATLTDRALLYRGGDGQEVMAHPPNGLLGLPSPLRVAVMRGRTPVAGAAIRWSVAAGDPQGAIDGQQVGSGATFTVPTGSDGLCAVGWAIDAGQPDAVHRVRAELVGPSGAGEGPALVFSATFRTAANTSYQPGACDVLATSRTVQEALDELCRNLGGAVEPETLSLTAIRLFGGGGFTDLLNDTLIFNGLEVPFDAFADAINFGISGRPIASSFQDFDPVVEVELDLPYPITDPDRQYWAVASQPAQGEPGITGMFGFQRVRLDGSTRIRLRRAGDIERGLLWTPSKQANRFLQTLPAHLGGSLVVDRNQLGELQWQIDERQPRILCRLRVRSAHVWAVGENERRIYLNAEHLGTSAGATDRELLVNDRDPQRAADLDMYFYLRLG